MRGTESIETVTFIPENIFFRIAVFFSQDNIFGNESTDTVIQSPSNKYSYPFGRISSIDHANAAIHPNVYMPMIRCFFPTVEENSIHCSISVTQKETDRG